jgi:hypothetical protein
MPVTTRTGKNLSVSAIFSKNKEDEESIPDTLLDRAVSGKGRRSYGRGIESCGVEMRLIPEFGARSASPGSMLNGSSSAGGATLSV